MIKTPQFLALELLGNLAEFVRCAGGDLADAEVTDRVSATDEDNPTRPRFSFEPR